MSKRVITGMVVALVIIGGGGAYLLTKDEDKKNSTANTSQTNNNQQTSNENTFSPVSTQGLPFVATISTSGAAGNSESKLEYDGKGKSRYLITQNGQQVQIIYTSDAYYYCTGDNCIKYPIDQSGNSGFNPADYTYDDTKLANYKNATAYQGRQDCLSGTCDVWSATYAGSTSTMYLDSKTKRIVQVEGTVAGTTSKITYEYKDVSIEVPANAQTFPTGQ